MEVSTSNTELEELHVERDSIVLLHIVVLLDSADVREEEGTCGNGTAQARFKLLHRCVPFVSGNGRCGYIWK